MNDEVKFQVVKIVFAGVYYPANDQLCFCSYLMI